MPRHTIVRGLAVLGDVGWLVLLAVLLPAIVILGSIGFGLLFGYDRYWWSRRRASHAT